MKKVLALLVLVILLLMTLPVFAVSVSEYETLRLGKENIENNLRGNTASFRMMDKERTSKKLEINDAAIKFMSEKGIKLTVETNIMTFTVTSDAFRTQQWLEAVKSGDPVGIRLLVKKGSGSKVADSFDEWYYNQIGLSRFGTSAWELSGEILVGGVTKYDFDSFAAPVDISVKYPVSEVSGIARASSLEMHVLNEGKEKWDYLGGTVDQINEIISFNTKVPGLFIILSNKKPQGFTDIQGHWAERDIQYMLKKNVVSVTGDNKFHPNRVITRVEFALFLVKTLGLENSTGTNKFQDVGTGHPYYKEVLAAANSGIVSGVSADKFLPDAEITRQEIAAMMARALKRGGVLASADKSVLEQFRDGSQIASWASDSCAQVVLAGLMSGRSGGMFEPKSSTSRAEALVLLHRLSDKLGKK